MLPLSPSGRGQYHRLKDKQAPFDHKALIESHISRRLSIRFMHNYSRCASATLILDLSRKALRDNTALRHSWSFWVYIVRPWTNTGEGNKGTLEVIKSKFCPTSVFFYSWDFVKNIYSWKEPTLFIFSIVITDIGIDVCKYIWFDFCRKAKQNTQFLNNIWETFKINNINNTSVVLL